MTTSINKYFFRIFSAIIFMILIFCHSTFAQSVDDDLSFENTIELMYCQLKMETLQMLYARGFHIPSRTFQYYFNKQQSILEDLKEYALSDINALDQWIEAEKKVEQKQDLEMQEIIEKYGKIILKEGCKMRETLLLFDMAVNKRKTGHKIDSILMGKILTNLLQNAQADDKNTARCLKSIKNLYKGFIKERSRLDLGLKRLELERLELFASLRCVQDIMKSIDTIDMFEKSPGTHIKEKTEKMVTEYLKTLDPGVDEHMVKKISNTFELIAEKSYGAISTWQEVNKNPLLPESTKKMGRWFGVMGSGLACAVGILNEFEVLKWTGPLLDFFDFYAQSMLLIPTVAQKFAATIDRVDQGYQGARLLNEFNNIPSALGLFNLTTFSKKLVMKGGLILPDAVDIFSSYTPIKIGYEEGNEASAHTFYFIVSPEENQKKFIELSPLEFQRLEQIVSDERLVNAADEAKRSLTDYFLSSALADKEASPVSEYAAESYLSSLRDKAKLTYFSEQELVMIAQGKKEDTDFWEQQRDTKLLDLAIERAIRKATNSFEEDDVYVWNDYLRALRPSGLKIDPLQIIKLFNTFKSNQTAFAQFLDRKKGESEKKLKGSPVFGMPEIQLVPNESESDVVKPGSEENLETSIVLGGLAPDRKVMADVEWELPWGNHSVIRSTVELSNGEHSIQQPVHIPEDVKSTEQVVKLHIKVIDTPGDPPIVQSTEGYFSVSAKEFEAKAPIAKLNHVEYDRKLAEVMTREASKIPLNGTAVYAGQELNLKVDYTITSGGVGYDTISCRFQDEKNPQISYGMRSSPSKPGSYSKTLMVLTPPVSESKSFYVDLVSILYQDLGKGMRPLILDKSPMMTITSYPRGWALTNILLTDDTQHKEDRSQYKNQQLKTFIKDGEIWFERHAKASIDYTLKGVKRLKAKALIERIKIKIPTIHLEEQEVIFNIGTELLVLTKEDQWILISRDENTPLAACLFDFSSTPHFSESQGSKNKEDDYAFWNNADTSRYGDMNSSGQYNPYDSKGVKGIIKSRQSLNKAGWEDHLIFSCRYNELGATRMDELRQTVILVYSRLDENGGNAPMRLSGEGNQDIVSVGSASESGNRAGGEGLENGTQDGNTSFFPETHSGQGNVPSTAMPHFIREMTQNNSAGFYPLPEQREKEKELSPLELPDPWNDAQIQVLIDEWIRISEPGVKPSGPNDKRKWRWTEWGVMESPPSVVATGKPDARGMGRYQYLFTGGDRLMSLSHYSLREYIERRLRGESGVGVAPVWTFSEENPKNRSELKDFVVLKTNQGIIKIQLFPKIAPKACENFVQLVEKGYYNGTLFHRVIKGFMIQGGDPTGSGTGGQSIWGKNFENEVSQNVQFDKKGMVAMSNAGPHKNGSQFFITTAPASQLNMQYTLFGKVISGFSVLEKIENTKTGQSDKPLIDQTIIEASAINEMDRKKG